MRDILVRLAYTHPLCTCLTKTPELVYHDELCTYRVVREAESEILRLRSENKEHTTNGR
jgi:hypothetical protein